MLVVNTDKNSIRERNSYLSNDPYGPVPIIPEKSIVRADVFRNGRVDVSRSGHHRVKKLKFRALALRQRNCGLYVGLKAENRAKLLVGIWCQENKNKSKKDVFFVRLVASVGQRKTSESP